MTAKIFILEVILNQINFESDLEKLPDISDFKVGITFSNVLRMDLNPNYFTNKVNKRDEKCWGLNIGKSCIFTYNPQSLAKELIEYPLELLLKAKNKKVLGKAIFPWKKEFSDMVNVFEQIGVVKSVDHTNNIAIMDKKKKIGTVRIYIRMGCGGDGLETDLRLRNDFRQNAWVLMNTKTMNSVLFEGYDPNSNEIVPVARLYNTTLNIPHTEATNLSWVDVPRQQKKSDEFDMFELYAGNSAFDVISVCFTPNTNFFDFIIPDTSKRSRRSLKSKEAEDEMKKLTVKAISEKLCTYADCPGVKKFEELGIKNPTTKPILPDLQPPNKNILTHIEDDAERYSPQSVYKSPKHPHLPFMSPRDPSELVRQNLVSNYKQSTSAMKCKGAVWNKMNKCKPQRSYFPTSYESSK